MKKLILGFTFLLASNAFASSVCLVQAVRVNSGNDYTQAACDKQELKTFPAQSAYWTISDVASVLQSYTSQGYKVVGQSENIWTLAKD